MPIAAFIIGAIMIDLALRGSEHEFAAQAVTDFGGGSQFYAWAAAVLGIGAIGYIPGAQKVSSGLLTLVILVLVLRTRGAFSTIAQGIIHPPKPTPGVSLAAYKDPKPTVVSQPAASSSGGGGGSALGAIGSVIGIAAAFLSDAKLKTDIVRIGSHGAIGLYEFSFVGSTKRLRGVIAQDVLRTRPDAVGLRDGYLTVDYTALGLVPEFV